MNYYDLIEKYINAHKTQWSQTTIKSERSRLRSFFTNNNYTGKSNYSKLTCITRVNHFYDWLVNNKYVKENPYKNYKKKNKQSFQHVYNRQPAKYTYKEVLDKLNKITDSKTKKHALEILESGMRYKESLTRQGDIVVGKGQKKRYVYGPESKEKVNYYKLYRSLAKVGLKPHDLRKAFATRLVEKNLNEFDLCAVMGWESIETAKSYVAPKKHEQLKQIINE